MVGGLAFALYAADLLGGQQIEPAFFVAPPNDRMLAIADSNGPDNAPASMFDSSAILQCLT
jgi:GSH-dependent disulfide-bond oxidoreductase